MKKQIAATLVLVVAAALVYGACGSDQVTSPNLGNVRLYLTDKPLDLSQVEAVNVTLGEMILFAREDDDTSGMEMDRPGVSTGAGLTLNLLDLRDGRTALIGVADVPEGEYQKIRMIIESAELVRDDDGDPETPGVVEPIFVPSGKVDVPVSFTVTSGEDVDITLDFDAELSVQVNETPGRHPYILRPVITPVGVSKSRR